MLGNDMVFHRKSQEINGEIFKQFLYSKVGIGAGFHSFPGFFITP